MYKVHSFNVLHDALRLLSDRGSHRAEYTRLCYDTESPSDNNCVSTTGAKESFDSMPVTLTKQLLLELDSMVKGSLPFVGYSY